MYRNPHSVQNIQNIQELVTVYISISSRQIFLISNIKRNVKLEHLMYKAQENTFTQETKYNKYIMKTMKSD